MKQLLFIITFILSCFFNNDSAVVPEYGEKYSSAIIESAAQDDSDRGQNIHSNAILPTMAARLSGETGGCAPTIRSSNTLRRSQVSQKHPFRIIKAGKVIDRQHFFVFQTILYLFPSGINAISRYIHIICQLLI